MSVREGLRDGFATELCPNDLGDEGPTLLGSRCQSRYRLALPSYAGQIITYTFPHIGNVGTNDEDVESRSPTCRGLVVRGDITPAANWRAPAIWVHNSSKADILRSAQPRSAEPAR